MYGYVTPVKEQMNLADFALYRAFYCGICKATGRMFGQLPRFTTNYDIVFLSVLLHDFLVQEVRFESKGCVCNPFKKKTTVCSNPLLDKIVETNIILSYYKMIDGVLDKEGFKKSIAKSMLKKHYNKAKKSSPGIDAVISKRYNMLYEMEKKNLAGLDRVADCFAMILQDVAADILKEKASEPILKLCYNVGKFVYLADALDDIDEDFREKRYNPFLAVYPEYENRRQYFEKYKSELEFTVAVTVNRAIECFNSMVFTQSSDLLKNIVHKGLRSKAEQLFQSQKKLPKPRI